MNEAASPLGHLIRELRRRRVFRTAAIYIVGSWLIMQVADVLFPAMDIPERAIRYVFLAALAGFPAALLFGWFYDIGAQGIRRTPPAGPAELASGQPLARGDYILLTALAVVIIAILYNTVGRVAEEPVDQEIAMPAQRSGPPVVAVLPFTTTSLEEQSAFFASGVHDDLLTQLSKLQSIRVISRTSVLEYKDTSRNMREIGAELGADVIMEGGVQVAGDQIRINAQLIDSRTDEHLWAETFNRSLSAASIFDVQADIARAITTATNATLTEQDNQQLSIVPTDNMAAYRSYRLAMDNRGGGGTLTHAERAEALERAVALDPGFVRAWAELAGAYSLMSPDSQHIQNAERALEQITERAPGSADYFVAQAYYLYYVLKDYDRAHETLNKAISMVPSDVGLLELRSWIERRQGDFDARGATLRQMIQLDPRNLSYRSQRLTHLISTHQYDEALEAIDALEVTDITTEVYREILLLKDHGDFALGLDRLLKLKGRMQGADFGFLFSAYVANRMYTKAEEVIQLIPDPRDWRPGNLSWREELYLWIYWFTNDREALDEIVPRLTEKLEAARQEDGEFIHPYVYRYLSLVKGANGDRAESLRLLRKFARLDAEDVAGQVVNTSTICSMFGMNEAVSEAVACLRRGLAGPSYVMPFVDVYLPYYDAIRDEPEFIELVAEIEGATTH